MRLVVALVVVLAAPIAAQCPGDTDGDGRVTVAELVAAVASALRGCDDAHLAALLGLWEFRELPEGLVQRYHFEAVENGRIVGRETDAFGGDGSAIVVEPSGDPVFPLQLVDVDSSLCLRFRFVEDGTNRLTGSFVFLSRPRERCGAVTSPLPLQFEGVRLSG